MKFAASAPVEAIASHEVDETRTPDGNDEDDDNESDTKSEVDVENKESKLKAAREKHVRSALNEAVRFVQRPNEKKMFTTLFNESIFVQSRSSFTGAGDDCTCRHGWLYDCCADQEPKIADKSKNHVRGVSPQPDGPMAKMFFEAVLGIITENDILIAPNARSLGASRILLPLLKATHADSLNIIYKETLAKGRTRLHEVVHLAAQKSFGLQPARPRLHYGLTTTGSDSIVQAEDMDMPGKVEQQEKAAILGLDDMLQTEKMMRPKDKVQLFHWEKTQEVYEEMLHHLRLTGLTTASCGRLPLLKACVRMHGKCLALYRNETHHDILQRDLFAWMFEESLTNPKASYHVTRGDLIEQLGLTPDGPAVPPGVGSVRGEGSNKGSDPSSEEEGDEEDNKGGGARGRGARRPG
jgi:hypothetical protein